MMLTEVESGLAGLSFTALVDGLFDLATLVINFITSNTLMFVMFAGSLVGVACYVVRKVKKTSKA